MQQKTFARYKKPLAELPDLVQVQTDSYRWLVKEGLKELFNEFSPIRDYSDKKFQLEFTSFQLDEPKFDEIYVKDNKLTYDAPLRVRVKLTNKTLNVDKEQEIFLADFPLMTSHGTFIINGIERVVVPQLARSFGVFFTAEELRGRKFFGAKIMPARGAWVELSTEIDNVIYVRIDRKRKFPVTALLRVFANIATGKNLTDEEILALFAKKGMDTSFIEKSLAKDHAKTTDDAYLEIYKRLRDSDLATVANAKEYLNTLFSREKYDLSVVGRFRFNQRFDLPVNETEKEKRTVSFDDLILIINNIIVLNTTKNAKEDDIDHLGFRRVRCVGEMLQSKLKVGMTQMKRNIQDRMSTIENFSLLTSCHSL